MRILQGKWEGARIIDEETARGYGYTHNDDDNDEDLDRVKISRREGTRAAFDLRQS